MWVIQKWDVPLSLSNAHDTDGIFEVLSSEELHKIVSEILQEKYKNSSALYIEITFGCFKGNFNYQILRFCDFHW